VGDVDYFAFTATAGQKVFAYVDTGGAATGSSRNVILTLYASDGTTVLQSDEGNGTGSDGSSGSASIAGRTLPGTGTAVYYVEVASASGVDTVNPYHLYVSLVNPSSLQSLQGGLSFSSAPQISTGSHFITGSIACNQGVINSYYAMFATQGSRLFLSNDLSPDRSAGFYGSMYVHGQDGQYMAGSSSAAGGEVPPSNAFDYIVRADGMYYIRVFGAQCYNNASSPAYDLWIHDQAGSTSPPTLGPTCAMESEPNNDAAHATALGPTKLSCGVQGSISPKGDVDYYSFQATAGDHVYALADTGGPESGSSTAVSLTIYGPDGTTVVGSDSNDGLGNNGSTAIQNFGGAALAGLVLPTTGTYYAEVAAQSATDIVIPYRLFVTDVNAAHQLSVQKPDANPATANATPFATNEFMSPDGPDYYSFTAAAYQQVHIGISVSATVTLSDQNNVELLSDTRSNSKGFDFTAPYTGLYYLYVSYGGSYHVLISLSPTPTLVMFRGESVTPQPARLARKAVLTATTMPPAVCTAVVLYPKSSKAIRLSGTKVADRRGTVSWSWKPKSSHTGKAYATVTCRWNKQTQSQRIGFVLHR
jgi:hypothetical protein